MHNEQLVEEFHKKHGFDHKLWLSHYEGATASEALLLAATVIKSLSSQFESGHSAKSNAYDPRIMRAHLMLEELAETLQGLGESDEVKTLDGLADLMYVMHGTAVAFRLPLQKAFEEVHRSNMTKAVRVKGDVRLRNKGDDYSPPDLKGVINDSRR